MVVHREVSFWRLLLCGGLFALCIAFKYRYPWETRLRLSSLATASQQWIGSEVESKVGLHSVMGKRKSRKKPPAKARVIQPLDTQFNCPFCNHESSCEVKMDRARKTARITCHVCLECFQTQIHGLSEPVDVYNDWIDACEQANWFGSASKETRVS